MGNQRKVLSLIKSAVRKVIQLVKGLYLIHPEGRVWSTKMLIH